MLKISRAFLNQGFSFSPLSVEASLAKIQEIVLQTGVPKSMIREQLRLLAMQQAPGLPVHSNSRDWSVLALNDPRTPLDVTAAFLKKMCSEIKKREVTEPAPSISDTFLSMTVKASQGFRRFFEPKLVLPEPPVNESVRTDEKVGFSWITGKEYADAFLAKQVPGHHQMAGKSGVRVWQESSIRLELKPPAAYFQTPVLVTGSIPRNALVEDANLSKGQVKSTKILPAENTHLITDLQITPYPVNMPEDLEEHPALQTPFCKKMMDKFNPETDVRYFSGSLWENLQLLYYYMALSVPAVPRNPNSTAWEIDWKKAAFDISQDPGVSLRVERFMKQKIIESSSHRCWERFEKYAHLDPVLEREYGCPSILRGDGFSVATFHLKDGRNA